MYVCDQYFAAGGMQICRQWLHVFHVHVWSKESNTVSSLFQILQPYCRFSNRDEKRNTTKWQKKLRKTSGWWKCHILKQLFDGHTLQQIMFARAILIPANKFECIISPSNEQKSSYETFWLAWFCLLNLRDS